MLHQVTAAVYLNGRLIHSYVVGTVSYDEADALESQLQRDYPGCQVQVKEW